MDKQKLSTPCKSENPKNKHNYIFNEEENIYICKFKKPYDFNIYTTSVLYRLFNAAELISNYAPNVEAQIAYLKLFFSIDQVQDYIDPVINESYNIIKHFNNKNDIIK